MPVRCLPQGGVEEQVQGAGQRIEGAKSRESRVEWGKAKSHIGWT